MEFLATVSLLCSCSRMDSVSHGNALGQHSLSEYMIDYATKKTKMPPLTNSHTSLLVSLNTALVAYGKYF